MARIRTAKTYPPVVIGDPAELRVFAATRAFASRQPLVFAIPGMPMADAAAFGERLNTDRAACGCSLGAQAMAAGFAVTLAILMLRYGPFSLAVFVRLPIAIAVAVIFAGIGKAAGAAAARRRAHREVDRILGVFAARH